MIKQQRRCSSNLWDSSYLFVVMQSGTLNLVTLMGESQPNSDISFFNQLFWSWSRNRPLYVICFCWINDKRPFIIYSKSQGLFWKPLYPVSVLDFFTSQVWFSGLRRGQGALRVWRRQKPREWKPRAKTNDDLQVWVLSWWDEEVGNAASATWFTCWNETRIIVQLTFRFRVHCFQVFILTSIVSIDKIVALFVIYVYSI